MGASVEHQFLCKVIETGDFHTVQKLKINEGFFLGDQTQYKEIFRWLSAHFHHPHTAGTIPSWQIVSSWFPSFAWIWTQDSVATLCGELRKAKLRAQIIGLADEIVLKASADPEEALNVVKEASAKLHTEHEVNTDSLMTSAYDMLMGDYLAVQAGQGVTGIPFPWTILNEDTQGIHDEDYVIVFGRPKSMKSWIAFLMATTAYYQYRRRVLIWSMEMSRILCLRRCAAIIAQVDYERFKNAKLDPGSFDRTFQTLQWLRRQEQEYLNPLTGREPALLVTSPYEEKATAGVGIGALQAKIREFEPDLVVVDGMYLMKDDRDQKRSIDWKAVAHVSQDLKITAKTFKVPIIATTQANRTAKDPNDKEADLSELAYADALAQDCDLAIRVHKQRDQNKETELVLSIPGSREGKLDGFVIHGHPAVNFTFKRMEIRDPNDPNAGKQQQKNGKSNGSNGAVAAVARQVPQLPNWRNP